MDASEVLSREMKFSKKEVSEFRDYTEDENDPIKERVRRTYFEMHRNMTVDFVKGMLLEKERKKMYLPTSGLSNYYKIEDLSGRIRRTPERNIKKVSQTHFAPFCLEKMAVWLKFKKFRGNIMETLSLLNNLVDESDPDVDIPNIVHAFQTAERIREEYPEEDWFHLTGLIHDMGKVMALFGEPQWCVVGDTFPVGCRWAESIVYGAPSFRGNPDEENSTYNTKYGMYSPNCGLDNLLMSWGHDEYLYRVLKHNKCKLPEQALYMIRYHSFYPWHTGGDYTHLCNEHDKEKLKWVVKFNKYDLYTKNSPVPDIENLKPYYQSLIEKYIPGELEW